MFIMKLSQMFFWDQLLAELTSLLALLATTRLCLFTVVKYSQLIWAVLLKVGMKKVMIKRELFFALCCIR